VIFFDIDGNLVYLRIGYIYVQCMIALALIAGSFSGWLKNALNYGIRIVMVILAFGLCLNNVSVNLIALVVMFLALYKNWDIGVGDYRELRKDFAP
jgi:TRAP-type uncharacterized transport system fused permease subunit